GCVRSGWGPRARGMRRRPSPRLPPAPRRRVGGNASGDDSLAPAMAAPLQELQFRRLLVAIDGSPSADLALSAAVTAARRNNASLTLVAVAPDVVANSTRFAMPTPVMPSQDEADDQAQRILREAIERIPDEIPVTTLMKRGRPGHAIVAASKDA